MARQAVKLLANKVQGVLVSGSYLARIWLVSGSYLARIWLDDARMT